MKGGLRKGDPGYGPTCPKCGGPKSSEARECAGCTNRPGGGAGGLQSRDAIETVGRRESIITFRERDTGEIRTRHCFGIGRPEQLADGLLQLPDGAWEVECISTPASILRDLRGRSRPHRDKIVIAAVGLLCGAVGALILAAQAQARPPVPGPVFAAVRAEWKTRPERIQAFDVIACETGGTYSTRASNGQYLGIFQMGARERARFGHGLDPRSQARAARAYFAVSGWAPWRACL